MFDGGGDVARKGDPVDRFGLLIVLCDSVDVGLKIDDGEKTPRLRLCFSERVVDTRWERKTGPSSKSPDLTLASSVARARSERSSRARAGG